MKCKSIVEFCAERNGVVFSHLTMAFCNQVRPSFYVCQLGGYL